MVVGIHPWYYPSVRDINFVLFWEYVLAGAVLHPSHPQIIYGLICPRLLNLSQLFSQLDDMYFLSYIYIYKIKNLDHMYESMTDDWQLKTITYHDCWYLPMVLFLSVTLILYCFRSMYWWVPYCVHLSRGVARNEHLGGPGCNRNLLNIILKSIGYKIINFHISSYT